MHRGQFETYINERNREGSGRANSYIKALELLSEMLQIEAYDFKDCTNIWSVSSVERLQELRSFVLKEQKKGSKSPWRNDNIPISYLRDGYCSAALAQLIEFLPQHQYSEWALETLQSHIGNEIELREKLNVEPEYPESLVHSPSSIDGIDRIREAKARIGQQAFRKMILYIYQNRCCITGLDIPAINRASHIVGWAERKETRMDPQNGLCLSATYDAAFDKHLISLDQDYRVLISRDISDHYTSESVKTHFLRREGQAIELPKQNTPNQEYLEEHRQAGDF